MTPQQRYNFRNKEKIKIYDKAYKQKHRNRIRKFDRDYAFKRLYGITLNQYNTLVKKQNARCAICAKPEIKFHKRLSVDHNHTTGKVRGLLCLSCNTKLAVIENDKFVLLAKNYLKEYDYVSIK